MPFYTKNNKLWGCDQTKGFGSGAVDCGMGIRKCMGKTNVSRFVCTSLFQHWLPVFSSWYREGTFLKRNFMTCVQVERGQRALTASAVYQVPSAQINMPKRQILVWHVLNSFLSFILMLRESFIYHTSERK